jgi:[NiFe] hydrogenase large subunit
VRAVDNAVGVKIPQNARIIRNLLMGAQFQQDHIVHFYHLHAPDWVDVVSALSADPKKTAVLSDNVSNAPWGDAVYFKNVLLTAASWAPLPMRIGDIPLTSCRLKQT